MDNSRLSPEALDEVNAAFERYEEEFERAVALGVYKSSTWKNDYRPRAKYFVEWLNGTFNPSEGHQRR